MKSGTFYDTSTDPILDLLAWHKAGTDLARAKRQELDRIRAELKCIEGMIWLIEHRQKRAQEQG